MVHTYVLGLLCMSLSMGGDGYFITGTRWYNRGWNLMIREACNHVPQASHSYREKEYSL